MVMVVKLVIGGAVLGHARRTLRSKSLFYLMRAELDTRPTYQLRRMCPCFDATEVESKDDFV